MKESITKFDLMDAFKALEEIEYPEVKGGIKARKDDYKPLHENLAKRAMRTDILIEDYYDIDDQDDLEAAANDREAEVAKAKLARIEKIVDLDADSEEDLLTSYTGKVIIQCPQCMTLFYKNEEDLSQDEENPDVVNINETCQHCGNNSGYMVIGKVAPVEEEELNNFEDEDVEDIEENELNLDFEDEEPKEEPEEESTEEDEEELNLDLDLEDEEEANESLNISKAAKSDNESENSFDKLTLNEAVEDEADVEEEEEAEAEAKAEEEIEAEPIPAADVVEIVAETAEEIKEVVEADEDQAEAIDEVVEEKKEELLPEEAEVEEEPEEEIEEAKCCEKCGKNPCECDKLEEASIAEAALKKFVDSLDECSNKSAKKFVAGIREAVEIKVLVNEVPEEETCEGGICVEPICVDGVCEEPAIIEPVEAEEMTEVEPAIEEPVIEEPVIDEIPAEEEIDEVEEEEVEESLNSSKVQKDAEKSELKTENESENLTLNEEAIDKADIEELFNSKEFKKPVSEAEVEAAFEEDCSFEEADDLDDESLNENISKYFTTVYENVNNFKATNCAFNNNKLIIEGTINFKSGAKKATTFEFEQEGNKLIGVNESIAEGKAFTVDYNIKQKTIFVENLSYKYLIDKNLVEGFTRK